MIDRYKFHLIDADKVMLQEIKGGCTRNDLAVTYAFGITSDYPCDFKRVNQAIIKRWSVSGLDYIKRKAWKMIGEKLQEGKEAEEEDGR